MNWRTPDFGVDTIMNLSCIRALITRPEPMATLLVNMIRQANGQAFAMPMLEISPIPESQSMRNKLLMLDEFDKIIITSRFAACFGMELIATYWPQIPVKGQWFSIGSGTAAELDLFDIRAHYSKTGIDSEALLALNAFRSVQNEKVLIIKGLGGRDLLQKQLNELGANLHLLEVYKRSCPIYEANTVVKALDTHRINTIICGSGETVDNLAGYLPQPYRYQYCVLVPSQRIARQARNLYFQQIINVGGASNEAILHSLNQVSFK